MTYHWASRVVFIYLYLRFLHQHDEVLLHPSNCYGSGAVVVISVSRKTATEKSQRHDGVFFYNTDMLVMRQQGWFSLLSVIILCCLLVWLHQQSALPGAAVSREMV